MNNFLQNILDHKRKLNEDRKVFLNGLREKISNTEFTRYQLFKKKISIAGSLNLIAEIKKASPSKGLIREDFDVIEIAKIYVENKAAAISVLTEEKYFLGNPNFIKRINEKFSIPLLTKDFIIDEGQIIEAQFNGASAVLLIVAVLSDQELKAFIDLASRLDLDCLVEVHTEEEISRAVDAGAEIIGINNRDLTTFNVDFHTTERLVKKVPDGKIIVAESGIKSRDDINQIKALGVHAVLIGEAFMREKDIAAKIKELMDD